MKWYEIIITICTGLATCVPLMIALVQYVQKAIKEKNWNDLLKLVMNLIQQAENKFATGTERKEWVLMSVKASADTINYDIDMDEVSALIDSLCSLTRNVNIAKSEQVNEEG